LADRKKILITGASGLIGGVLGRALSDGHEVSGVDTRLSADFPVHIGNMSDLASVQAAFEGIDVVIDLASNPSQNIPWDIAYGNNIACTMNAFQAAEKAGVKRVIFASSNHATGNYENDKPYSDIVAGMYDGLDASKIPLVITAMPIRPDGPYGVAKAFGEATARYYSDLFGMSTMCLRIGTLNRESRPTNVRHFATLLTHNDLAQLVRKCVEAPDSVRFGIYYGVSNNKWRFWDIANSRKDIGYEPQDNAEAFR
jgi:nucleoside-diphosphate-sugar epimerase